MPWWCINDATVHACGLCESYNTLQEEVVRSVHARPFNVLKLDMQSWAFVTGNNRSGDGDNMACKQQVHGAITCACVDILVCIYVTWHKKIRLMYTRHLFIFWYVAIFFNISDFRIL